MKVVTIGPERLGGKDMSLQDAFNLLNSEEIMKKVYGPSLIVGEWEDCRRRRVLTFDIELYQVPKEILSFLGVGGGTAGVNVESMQELVVLNDERWQIHNKIKINMLMGDLLDIAAVFAIHRGWGGDGGGEDVFLTGVIEHNTRFPSFISGIAEGFMALQTEKILDVYRNVLLMSSGSKSIATS